MSVSFTPPPSHQGSRSAWPAIVHGRLGEAAVVVLLFVATAPWGTMYWKRSLQAGRQPQFYQSYFEPAVMLACGRGFLIAHPPVPAVVDFLERKSDSLSCADIPPTTVVSDQALYQRPWLYLMLTVAITWKLLGISWSGMGPLFGVLFGLTIIAAYGILRIGLSRAVAIAGAVVLAVSAVHLQNLPHLRDYAKAPLTLALIWLLMVMATVPPTWRRLPAIGGVYGLILGIGYGFRTDFLVEIPVFFCVLFAFVAGGWRRHLWLKFASAAVCLAVFVAVSWPVISAVSRRGGCQWHAGLLGLTDPYNESLMITPGPYSFGHAYSDNVVYAMTTGFARRIQPDTAHVEYCSPEYDAASGRYLAMLAATFPGDFVTRTFSSVEQIVRVPFRWNDTPLPGFAGDLYRIRWLVLLPLRGTGAIFVGLAIAFLAAVELRLGLFALFLMLYFGGYPMLQFDVRHYFHLEVLTWWSVGFVVEQIVRRVRQTGVRGGVGRIWRTASSGVPLNWTRAGAMVVVVAVCAVGTLWAARAYQRRAVTALFHEYIDAPREQIRPGPLSTNVLYPLPTGHPPGTDPYPVDVVEVETDTAHCDPRATVTFRYREPLPEFTHVVAIAGRADAAGHGRVFEPVYDRFEGVEIAGSDPGCVIGVYRLSAPDRLKVLLSATLVPGWERRPLYERRLGLQWAQP
ncbi:MAG TPA: hypothetical protein VKB36_11660 [Vicinamibacterales bacterium]|nr:hypothetical protein [Vicinamibacterales bacterium]